jgi:hypothetical protein
MLGASFPPATLQRGIGLGADVIAVDAGSTDSGPHYLGTATAKTARAAVYHDLELLLAAARETSVPLIVGSCGTSGTDAGVDWVFAMTREIAERRQLSLKVARIYSELRHDRVLELLRQHRISPLEPARPLTPDMVRRCSHIVGLMGHEPIAAALACGADVVLAGRATDTALTAALPLSRGLPPGPTWHAAKVAECGGLCTTSPNSGGVLVTIDDTGFEVEPLAETAACTPMTVAAHMLYENADPFRLREPAGTLDVSAATYKPVDPRRVRVEGSVWVPAERNTAKLEGAAPVGFQTWILSGIRDPNVLAQLDHWCTQVLAFVGDRVRSVLSLDESRFSIQIRRYGYDAVLGTADPDRTTSPKEVGILFMATAQDQETATQIAKIANPILLHAPLDFHEPLPSFAFVASPAEVERGEVHEFVLQHVVELNTTDELVRTEVEQLHYG